MMSGGLLGAERGDARVQRFGIGALEDGFHLVIRSGSALNSLASLVDHLVVGAGHGVPPRNLGDGKGGRG
jgi:hypothetical protein